MDINIIATLLHNLESVKLDAKNNLDEIEEALQSLEREGVSLHRTKFYENLLPSQSQAWQEQKHPSCDGSGDPSCDKDQQIKDLKERVTLLHNELDYQTQYTSTDELDEALNVLSHVYFALEDRKKIYHAFWLADAKDLAVQASEESRRHLPKLSDRLLDLVVKFIRRDKPGSPEEKD